MNKIKIAQIGTSQNSHGNMVFESLTKNNDLFEFVGYVFPENEHKKFPEKSKVFESYRELTLDEVLNNQEIKAVAIETEEIYLSKYALMAAQHKKHIHMEKPGGLIWSEFENLIKTVKENKTIFHMGYMYRYNPLIIQLKEQIKNGEFGDILSVDAQMSCSHSKEVREWLRTFQGGMMFFLGCHLVDLIFSIQGMPQKIIPLNKCSGVDGVNSEDFGMVVFEYERGNSFVKTSAVELGGFARRQLVVSGTKKTVEIKPLEWFVGGEKLVTTKKTYDSNDWHVLPQIDQSVPIERYSSMIRDFGDIVLGRKENIYDYDYELKLYKLILNSCGIKIK